MNSLYEYHFKAMGGEFVLNSFPENYYSKRQLAQIFKNAKREVERVEDQLTDFRESPFNQINKFAGKNAVEVSSEILNLLKRAINLSEKTKGLFDISSASLGHIFREAKKRSLTPSTEEINYYRQFVNYKDIEIDEKQNTVFLPHRDMKIGLGGIGRGYAIDRAFTILRSFGLSNFLVNGSGDIRVYTDKDTRKPWNVSIQNPFTDKKNINVGLIKLNNGAVATSGAYRDRIDAKSRLNHHIIDPSTGFSSNFSVSGTVVSKAAENADSLATTLLLMEPYDAIDFLDNNDYYGFVIDKFGKVYLSNKAKANFLSHN